MNVIFLAVNITFEISNYSVIAADNTQAFDSNVRRTNSTLSYRQRLVI